MSAALTKVERVWIDGREVPYEHAGVPVDDPGIVRGDGVFEVVRLYGGRRLALDDHLARLERSARGSGSRGGAARRGSGPPFDRECAPRAAG